MNSIKTAVIKTLAYFEIYDIPLKKEEIFIFLFNKKTSKDELNIALGELVAIGKIKFESGYYFLFNNHINKRLEKINTSRILWEKAQKICTKLSKLPFVKMIGVCHGLALDNATQKSDIDLFIITSAKRIYFSRIILWLYLTIIGQKETRTKKYARFSLGFIIDENSLDLTDFTIKPVDPLYIYMLANLTPIYDDNIYETFVNKNKYLLKNLPNFTIERRNKIYCNKLLEKSNSLFKSFVEYIFSGFLGNIIENLLFKIHLNHELNLTENQTKNSHVVIEPQRLKLHAIDMRKSIYSKWVGKIKPIDT